MRLFDAGASWQQTGIVTASDAGAGYGFGDTVLLHQGQLIVGSASPEHILGEGAYVFQPVGSGWSLSETLAPHGPTSGGFFESFFGCALAADGGDLFVGSAGDDQVLPDSGAVYAYRSCGTSYCLSTVNSTGASAQIGATGDLGIAGNAFTLQVAHAPPSEPGMFFYGSNQVQVPFGNGFLCVGGGTHRLSPPMPSDASGTSSRWLDFNSPPAGGGPGLIVAGPTWRFQFWYRDPLAGGAFFNLSDALATTFVP